MKSLPKMNSSLLKQALISEKSFQATSASKFTFVVGVDADKENVAKAVTEVFGVEVLDVNIIRMKGKIKRTRKGYGKRPDFKKAILTLKKGQKVDLFEVEADKQQDAKTKHQDTKKKEITKEKVSDTKVVVRNKKEAPRKVI